jgi:hypothetical protein
MKISRGVDWIPSTVVLAAIDRNVHLKKTNAVPPAEEITPGFMLQSAFQTPQTAWVRFHHCCCPLPPIKYLS